MEFNKWFESLSKEERKKIISLLFSVRESVNQDKALFDELISKLDSYYHSLK